MRLSKLLAYTISNLPFFAFVCADDGYKVETPLPSSLIDKRVMAFSKLLVQDEVLHLLRKNKYINIYIIIFVVL